MIIILVIVAFVQEILSNNICGPANITINLDSALYNSLATAKHAN